LSDLFKTCPFDIDVVYTWVDGTDRRWLEERRKYAPATDHAADAHDTSRWEDYGTLKWSLRSIAKYMPWVRRVYVVTDNQRPAWLKENERLRVISHAELFADYVERPTYNSHVIESQLHRIEGLSEHFIYFNDDMVVTRRRTPKDFFFSNGIAKIFPGGAPFVDPEISAIAVNVAGRNMQKLLGARGWAPLLKKMRHTMYPLVRSVLRDMEIEFSEQFSQLGKNRFRSDNDIAPVSQMFQYYAYLNRKAVWENILTAYIDVGSRVALKDWIKLLTAGDYPSVCINCSLSDGKFTRRNTAIANRVLGWKFPNPSPWEV
jgi:hypothetical protein